MDDPKLNPEEHRLALKDLERINFWSRTADVFWQALPQRPLKILDVACGAGNLAIELAARAKKTGLDYQLFGIDCSPVAIEWAKHRAAEKNAGVKFYELDIFREEIPSGFDVIFTSLFLHHLDHSQAVSLLRGMAKATRQMILVDDLERNLLGYFLAFLGTRILARSRVVHADSLLSVRAAFNLNEVSQLAHEADLEGCRIRRHWPMRFLLSWER